MRTKHVPQRTCVVCATKSSKRDLIRIVRAGDHGVSVDETGKRSGRGAYICHDPACWQGAVRDGRLARALRTQVSESDTARLMEYAAALHLNEAPAL